jgi:hypothetical protein
LTVPISWVIFSLTSLSSAWADSLILPMICFFFFRSGLHQRFFLFLAGGSRLANTIGICVFFCSDLLGGPVNNGLHPGHLFFARQQDFSNGFVEHHVQNPNQQQKIHDLHDYGSIDAYHLRASVEVGLNTPKKQYIVYE